MLITQILGHKINLQIQHGTDKINPQVQHGTDKDLGKVILRVVGV